jgi:hypothetical protein
MNTYSSKKNAKNGLQFSTKEKTTNIIFYFLSNFKKKKKKKKKNIESLSEYYG